jgi:hypothetical protein
MKRNPILSSQSGDNDNPLELLTNLFDVAMVFAVALMVALVAHYNMSEIFTKESYTIVKNPGTDDMEIITKEGNTIKKYTQSENNAPTSGNKGRRVGTAYQLENGEIIYIPE